MLYCIQVVFYQLFNIMPPVCAIVCMLTTVHLQVLLLLLHSVLFLHLQLQVLLNGHSESLIQVGLNMSYINT